MSGGRTVWRAKDAGWWRREWIVALGVEFGCEGPTVIDWLECEAKAQNDGGVVKAGPLTVSRGCFVDVVTVGHVLSRAVTLGLLLDYREHEGRFVCRIAWWQADQEKAMAANRKAKQRAGTPVEPDDPPPLSRSVPECPPTGQDRIDTSATQRNSNAELRSAVIEVFAYWQDRCGHQQAQLGPDRRGKIETRLRERAKLGGGMHQAIADIRLAIDGAALAPFIDERGKRHDDIELICRKGSKLEDFMGRASLPAAAATVLPFDRKSTVSELHRKLMANEGEAS